MEAVEALEMLKEEVVSKLGKAGVALLTEICVELDVEVPTRKAGIKSALFNLVVVYLSSPDVEDSADGGLEMLTGLKTKLDSKLGLVSEPSAVKSEDGGSGKQLLSKMKRNSAATDQKSSSSGVTDQGNSVEKLSETIDRKQTTGAKETEGTRTRSDEGDVSGIQLSSRLHGSLRLREFKIHSGTIGGESQLDFDEVCYQIEEGRALGYDVREIIAGVIKATKPGCSLRKFLQTKKNLKYEALLSNLRSHYGMEDSQEMLEAMRKMKQEPTEKVVDYVRRVMAMRNSIIAVNKEEDHDIGIAVVMKACFRTILLGLRRDTIRLELRGLMTDISVDDEKLLEEISQVAAMDKKHLELMNPKGVETCALNTEMQTAAVPADHGSGSCGMDNTLLWKVSQNLAAHVNELEAVRARLDRWEKRWGDGAESESTPKPPQKTAKFQFKFKCANCEKNKAFCTHCSKCGKGDHKRKDCPEN